jgi:surface antigen
VLARVLASAMVSGVLAGGLVGLSAGSAHADDDYPWAWQGQCPILPQQPIVEPTPSPAPSPTPLAPGETPAPVVEPPPPPPPVLDPVSGHLYDPRGPRPTCASNVWSINGSIGDSWGFVLRNCTSFVSWRLHQRNKMTGFANDFRGRHWGNADRWDDVARSLGYRVDSVPAIGAVAQTDAGRVGHVAWVSAIGAGTVTVEEYNHAVPGGYGTRTVPVGTFRYLHLDDVAPSPLLGSDRPVVSVPDGLGESWTARVDAGGTLRVAAPGRHDRVVGRRSAFSPLDAPALSLDHRRRPWVAATTRDGGVLVGTLRGKRFALRPVGTSAVTASPALAQSRTHRPVLATISPAGTLATRRLTQKGRWSHPERVGHPGSWATHTAPVLGDDDSGRTWLVAVGARGTTYARVVGKGRLVRLAGAPGSVTSTPALTRAADGTTYLHQVSAAGRLVVRTLSGWRWGGPKALDGDWSPYASPAVGMLGGRLHVAAVDGSGAVLVRAAVPGERSRMTSRIGTGDLTRSPGLVTRRNAGVFVVAGDRGTARLLTRPASAVVDRTLPRSAGFTP